MQNHKNRPNKVRTPNKVQNGKYLIKWPNKKLKHIKQIDNKCPIPELILVQEFSYVENDRLNLSYS